jgi:hypothetical protein
MSEEFNMAVGLLNDEKFEDCLKIVNKFVDSVDSVDLD